MNAKLWLKQQLFDKNQISPDLYRPLIYWLYIINPFKKTSLVDFPRKSDVKRFITSLRLSTEPFHLERQDLETFMSDHIHEYFTYFGTGYGKAFVGKAAEHYVSLEIAEFEGGVFVDVAASASPFYKIVKRIFPQSQVYRQDLAFPYGIHEDKIGGSAASLPLDDGSVDFMTLHNSIEHFEGDADTLFIQEAARVLKPGGHVVILPVFIQETYINYVNPTINPTNLQTDAEADIVYTYHPARFMRHYDVEALNRRVVEPAQKYFDTDFFIVERSEDFSEEIELALALRLTRL
jgi:SAM-dependent methyltransferase